MSDHQHLHPSNNTENYPEYQGQPVRVTERVIERVIEREPEPKKKKSGGFHIPNPFKIIGWIFNLMGKIRQIILTGCVIIVLLVVLLVVTLVVKPAILWNPLKAFLNDNINPVALEDKQIQDIYADINKQSKDTLVAQLNSNDVANLMRQKVKRDTDLRVELEPQLMRILVNIDTDEHPLWLVAELHQENEKMSLSKVGFGRFGLPGGINSFLGDQLFSLLTLTRQQLAGSTSTDLFSLLIDKGALNSGYIIKSVDFDQDQATIGFISQLNPGF